ncbi:16S rRNA (cytidine(1402)-2'-O)-methyltransferase [bacterium]|nr:16S rRNA (cytidine(1402)-2'-O)-methyltransferase [bacterium]NBS53023.1 16S rRNA (cytidine(1402)-2'-O)-methyltransferase [Spartobacteria bacterium]
MLTIVPTPIGNRQDITLRAIEALQSADVVAAEDTRHSGMLLQHLGIKKPFVSLHEHNEAARVEELAERMASGTKIALITDAGMPGISDPGHRLIKSCIERGLPVTVLPGPSAVITALVGSGFPTDRFFFGGFLPVKSGRRANEIAQAAARSETSIYFESPHRIERTLEALHAACPDRPVCVARELTKTFEEYRRGLPAEVLAHFQKHPPKGEITLVISADGKKRKADVEDREA